VQRTGGFFFFGFALRSDLDWINLFEEINCAELTKITSTNFSPITLPIRKFSEKKNLQINQSTILANSIPFDRICRRCTIQSENLNSQSAPISPI
jgi:hypothetical protein